MITDDTCHITVISADPLVVTGSAHSLPRSRTVDRVLDSLAERSLHFLDQLSWSRETPDRFQATNARLRELANRHPKHCYVILCNTVKELKLFRAAGWRAEHVTRNIFVNDAVFTVDANATKHFDAVCNSVHAPFNTTVPKFGPTYCSMR